MHAIETEGSWLAWCNLGVTAKGHTETEARIRLYAAIIAARDGRIPRSTGAPIPVAKKKRKR